MIKNRYKLWLAALALATTFAVPASAVQVDLLVFYDDYSSNYFNGQPGTAMQSWVSQMNTFNQNSQVDVQWRLVGTERRTDPGADQGDVLNNVRQSPFALGRRDALGADFVVQLHQKGACGVGYVAVDKNWAYAVVGPNCGPNAMAHELGHNMGLNHSRRQGDTTGTRYRYGVGYGVDNVFADMMAYQQSFGNAPKVPKYSNPNITCNGLVCGVPIGNSQEAFSAQAINNVKNEIAGFYPTEVGGGGPVANGTYELRNKFSNLCMDVAASNTADGAAIQQWGCNNTGAQSWIFTNIGSGQYTIKAQHSNKCMDVAGVSTANDALIHQWTCVGGANQKWIVINNGDGSVRLQAVHSGKIADTRDGSTAQGARIRQWDWIGAQNQRWIMRRK